jgi:hypothetical protein
MQAVAVLGGPDFGLPGSSPPRVTVILLLFVDIPALQTDQLSKCIVSNHWKKWYPYFQPLENAILIGEMNAYTD